MSYDERALRRPDFQEDSVPIVLADNGTWYFPKPYLEFFARVENGRVVGGGAGTHLGPEFDAVKDRLLDSGGQVLYADVLALAAVMLRHNYDLPDEAYAEILRLRPDDGASLDRLQALVDVALGAGPKASAAGDGSPASS